MTKPTTLTITPIWLRPFVAMNGGDATLLLRVTTAKRATAPHDRSPVDVAFVLDRSGSMDGEKIALARTAIQVASGRLQPTDRLSLVTYDHEVETPLPLTPATDQHRAALGEILRTVEARGATDLSGGWLTGCQQLANGQADGTTTSTGETTNARGSERVQRALLLTDGLANQGITDTEELAHHANELRVRGITTTTLGVGVDFDGPLLSRMAEAGGGNFAFIHHPAEMVAIFAQELDEIVNTVARHLAITLTLPTGATATPHNPYPAEHGETTLHIAIGELPEDTTIDLVITVTAPSSAAGTAHLLSGEASWWETDASSAGGGGRQAQTFALSPLVAIPAAEVMASPSNPLVTEAAMTQQARSYQRLAAQQAQSGDRDAARQTLSHLRESLSAHPLLAAPDSQAMLEDADDLITTMDQSASIAPEAVLRLSADGFRGGRHRRRRS